MKRLLRGGRVVDPANGMDGVFDVLIDGDRIAEVGKNLKADGAEIVDVPAGLIVCPGFIDMHVHLREPGQEHKETVATGVASAVAGGFTAVACMPNTKPVNDNAGVTRLILQKAAEAGLARVYPIGAVSRGQKGEELADIAELQGGRLRRGHRRRPAGGDGDPGASRARVHQHVQHADDRALRGSVAQGRRRRARGSRSRHRSACAAFPASPRRSPPAATSCSPK